MSIFRFITLVLLIQFGIAVTGFAAEQVQTEGVADVESATDGDHEAHEEAHHGLTPDAVRLTKIGPLYITNSMVVTWVVAALLILVSQAATRDIKLIPSGLQNFWEYLVENLYEFFEGIVGSQMVKKTFWFFATIFIFILATNWFGLIPGIGTIGWGHRTDHGFVVSEPLLRGVNADVNMTMAMALLFFVLWIVWAIQGNGVGGFFGHVFAVKGHGSNFLGYFLVAVFIFVGLIEIISMCVRPVALTFRLYGNVFAGENMLESVMHMGGLFFGWAAVLPFYLLEILVGLVQALVFALLTAVFTSLDCTPHGEHH